MIGAEITLQNTQIKSQELNDLTIFNTTILYGSAFVTLADLMNVPESEQAIIQASKETGMKCEVDILKDQIHIELNKARILMRKKFPIRYRLSLLKIFLEKPFSSIYCLIK